MGVSKRLWSRARHAPPFAMDAALAGAIFVAGVVELAFLISPSDIPKQFHQGVLSYVVMAGWALPIAFRRRNLTAAYVVSRVAVVFGIFLWTLDSFTVAFTIAQVVMLYTVAERWPAPAAAVGLAVENVINVVLTLVPYREAFHAAGLDLFHPFNYFTILYGLVFFAGRVSRRRTRLTERLGRLNGELSAEQARLSEEAVTAERRRIARELQVLVVRGLDDAKAFLATAVIDLNSERSRAEDSIEGIEAAGRATLVEMGRMLSLVDSGGPSLDVAGAESAEASS